MGGWGWVEGERFSCIERNMADLFRTKSIAPQRGVVLQSIARAILVHWHVREVVLWMLTRVCIIKFKGERECLHRTLRRAPPRTRARLKRIRVDSFDRAIGKPFVSPCDTVV